MKKAKAVFIAHCVLAAGLILYTIFAPDADAAPVDQDFDAKYKAWTIVCETQTEYSCIGIKPPIVRLVRSKDYRGYYNGGSAIFFSTYYYENTEPKLLKLVTLVHESAHYLMSQHGAVPLTSQKAICDSENFAFTLTNDWLLQQGRDDLIMVDWWRPRPGYRGYWKCFPWYGCGGYVISEPGFTRGQGK